MKVPEKFFKSLRAELDSCTNPLFFYDDDPDGLCSFLLFYRYLREGRGTVVKSTPKLGSHFSQKVEAFGPDKVFILDKPMVDDEFFEIVKTPTVWVDHHPLQEHGRAKYFNSRTYNETELCTSSIAYLTVKQDLWIGAVGATSDWTFPAFLEDVKKQYPRLLPKRIKTPETALFASPLGKLSRIFSFLLKGSVKDIYACVKILTRIKDPFEILDQTTAQGRFIYKRFTKLNELYENLLSQAKKVKTRDKFVIFTYTSSQTSLTNDLANELIYLFPKKLVIIGREKGGDVKMSIRAPWIDIPTILDPALSGIEGYGGGHAHACGACVKKEDFAQFVENLREQVKNRG